MYRSSLILWVYVIIYDILLSSLFSFNTSWDNSSILVDALIRSNANESIINLYYILWTAFTYLPYTFFTFGIVVSFNLAPTSYISTPTIIILLVYVFYLKTLHDFSILNQISYIQDSLNVSINLLLTNNVNKYHPPLLYLGIWYLLISMFRKNLTSQLLLNSSSRSTLLPSGLLKSVWYFYPLPVTLFFGSWWALQEGSWGGWWDSDISEMLGLLFFLSSVTYLHESNTYRNMLKSHLRTIYTVTFVITFYYFVQLNFNQTSHNFGLRTFLFFDNTFFLSEALFLLTLVTYAVLKGATKVARTHSFQNYTPLTKLSSKFSSQFVLTFTIYGLPLLWILFTSWSNLVSTLPLLSIFNDGSFKQFYQFFYFASIFVLILVQSHSTVPSQTLSYLLTSGIITHPVTTQPRALQTLSIVSMFHYLIVTFILSNLVDSYDTCILKSTVSSTNWLGGNNLAICRGNACWVTDSSISSISDIFIVPSGAGHHTLNHYYSGNSADAPNYLLTYHSSNTHLIEIANTPSCCEVLISNFTGVSTLLSVWFGLVAYLLHIPKRPSKAF